MIPVSISATSLDVFQACPARWAAEMLHKPPTASSAPANLGTAVHAALEDYVNWAFLSGKPEPDEDEGYLLKQFTSHYQSLFGDDSSMFAEGEAMLHKWWERTDFSSRVVISAERKMNFEVPYLSLSGEKTVVPLNYIWDRADQLDNEDIEIVDYKTWRMPVTAEKMRDKIQVRVYSLAARILYPQANRIWITLDQLRYDAVGTAFTRDDDAATWAFVKKQLTQIFETPEESAPEKIGTGCQWCLRRHTCTSLNQNITAGGISSLTHPELVARKAELDVRAKTLTYMVNEIDEILTGYAKENDLMTWQTPDYQVEMTMSMRRGVDAERAFMVIGPELAAKYGTITMGVIDKLLKSNEITEGQKAQLKSYIGMKVGEPKPKVTPLNPIDED